MKTLERNGIQDSAAGTGSLPSARSAEQKKSGSVLATALAAALTFSSFPAGAAINFSDETNAANVDHSSETYGASIGDINGDFYPDIFVSNHRTHPSLYLNLGNGNFRNVGSQTWWWLNKPRADMHGGSFSDFDNDGDQDLLISTGVGNPMQMLVNEGGALFYKSDVLGLDEYRIGGRLPVWMDYSGDKFPDFLMAQMAGLSVVLNQIPGGFEDETTVLGVVCPRSQYNQLLDADGDERLDVVCGAEEQYPRNVYNTLPKPWQQITSTIPRVEDMVDTIIADFNNDGRMDAFHLHGQTRPSKVSVRGNILEAMLLGPGVNNATANGIKSFTFDVPLGGPIDMNIGWISFANQFGQARVHIGSTGMGLSAEPGVPESGKYSNYTRTDIDGNTVYPGGDPDNIEDRVEDVTLTLDPSDPNVQGMIDPVGVDAPALIIGYDPATTRWTVRLLARDEANLGESVWTNAYFHVEASTLISGAEEIGFIETDGPTPSSLMMNFSGGWQNMTATAGLDEAILCSSATAGDYDNDMDVDLYLACRNGTENLANRLYENQGDGTFVEVGSAGGASGPTGLALEDRVGTADAAVSVDYNVDGYLDLFVTNGFNLLPNRRGGPDKLFRNQGGGNHWVQLKLIGVNSDRDATGAIVTALADGVTQTRVQNGGYHRWSQEFGPLHFGLASASTVDLAVTWPSGTMETYSGVAVDRVYAITEGEGIAAVTPGDTGRPYTCGDHAINTSSEQGIFILRDCNDNGDGYPWTIRMSPGGSSTTISFTGTVVSDQDIPFAEGRNLEDDFDSLDTTSSSNEVSFQFNSINSNMDGFDVGFAEGASACMTVTGPPGVNVYYGVNRVEVGTEVNLLTGRPCDEEEPEPPVVPPDEDDDDNTPPPPTDGGGGGSGGSGGSDSGSDGGGAGAIDPYWLAALALLPLLVRVGRGKRFQ